MRGDLVMRVEPSGAGLVLSLKRPRPLPPCEDRVRGQLSVTQEADIRHRICWSLDVGRPASRTVRNKRFLKPLSLLWYFVRAACTDEVTQQALILPYCIGKKQSDKLSLPFKEC